MEDMARLALVEQNVRDVDTFSKILCELLQHLNRILDCPHDYELRIIRSEALKQFLQYDALVDYLKSIGFQSVENEFTYPKEHTLSNLRVAQAAIERKMYFCYGFESYNDLRIKSVKKPYPKPPALIPEKVLSTTNELLLKIEMMFNDVLQYEDEELQAEAREHIPIVTLQLMAIDLMREQQRRIKTGETKDQDMPFDLALLHMLLSWFKHKFFTWVDAPPCEQCGGDTTHLSNSTLTTDTETCRLEIYKCSSCGGGAQFPRYNDVRALLSTRRGRCGEWANCFTLMCRALGYDTRLVYSTSDHVWCEVWDYDSNQWLHVDPCEGVLDAPLMYSHGWNRRLSYVLAFSRHDLQDVTWRYTTRHPEVLTRRTAVSEQALIEAILTLRSVRQRQVSAARRLYLARRCLGELAEFLAERVVCERELCGRVSGGGAWRAARGELRGGHVFRYCAPGDVSLAYYVTTDKYVVEGGEEKEVSSWAAGAYSAEHMLRKVEQDWKMVYLAREEGAPTGSISWALEAGGGRGGLQFSSLCVRAQSAVFEDGRVAWTVQFDDNPPIDAVITESTTEFSCRFRRAVLTARLSGGAGPRAWQHAQLFRAPLVPPAAPAAPALHMLATLHDTDQ